MSDTLMWMASMALMYGLMYGLMLAIAISSARDNWLGYPEEIKRRRWRIFWIVAVTIFLVVEVLCATGLFIVPLVVAGVIITVVVVGGFLAVMFGIGR